MDSPSDESGVYQSSHEVSTLTGTPGGDEGGTSAITLIAILFGGVAFAMAVFLALLFSSDLELYGIDGDSGGEDDVAKPPTHYPGGYSSPPAAVIEVPNKDDVTNGAR
ncbi:hypothetical protein MRX96_028703 [Rhipicephalus microplus]